MPKTRLQKEEMLGKIADRFSRSASISLISMTSVKVGEVEAIRDALFEHGLQLQVPKNRLLARILEENKVEFPAEVLDQPLGLVFSYEDAVIGPKTIKDLAKEIESIKIVGGVMDGAFLTTAQVESLAKLPSREQLLSQLVGSLASPLSGLVNVLQGNIRGLVTCLGQIRDAKA